MRFETSQHMRMSQSMKLAPRMIQNMEILQMPLNELEERIEQELENNPTLEIAEIEPDESFNRERAETRDEQQRNNQPLTNNDSADDSFERLSSYESENVDAAENAYSASGLDRFRDLHSPIRRSDDGDSFSAVSVAPARSQSLTEQLSDQWRLASTDPDLARAGDLLISFLDDDGYLRTPLETIVDRQPNLESTAQLNGNAHTAKKLTTDDLTFALEALHDVLDPPGVAARTVPECLLLQLAAIKREKGLEQNEPDDEIDTAAWLVEDHFDDLTNNRLPVISKATGLTIDEIQGAIKLLQKLSLAPARSLVTETTAAVIPDVIVEYDEDQDRYFAYLNDRRLPNLQVNREYAMLSKERSMPTRDKDFIKKNLANAHWLIDAMRQRNETLLRVVNVVIDRQREVFDFGTQSLKPLPMTEVAEQLGIHVATVSRAVNGKYIQTPRGVMQLRNFFSGGYQTESGSEVSYDAVKAAVKDVIDAENKAKPLSDEAVVKALTERGIDIARRTVAKYRDQLGIPSARLRREFTSKTG
ncbi:MAG: RNA polymerase factor sigma-54 [Phycisphaeraceae bacterium]|nr:RNA polymerase factor sigma-54 [Phycisphaerales bacterium]MCB9860229.1 RNA polymerase factor sigma-54 [Phycisphaeraceae bacterium]